MMFSAKTEYGLVALIELAAAYPTGERVQTGEICRRHGVPERYLEQMLTALRKGGYLVSVRGPKGGYQLTRSPELITVAEVEDCLEQPAAAHADVLHLKSQRETRASHYVCLKTPVCPSGMRHTLAQLLPGHGLLSANALLPCLLFP
jgi:Rrf2 family protein